MSSRELPPPFPNRDQSILPPNYNSWRYVDEASLYSIAEDSRENFSEVAPSEFGLDIPDTSEHGTTRVEVKWLEGDLDDMQSGPKNGSKLKLTPSTKQSDTDGHDDSYFFPIYNYRRRKYYIAATMAFIMVLAIVMAVVMATGNSNGSSRNSTNPLEGDQPDPSYDSPATATTTITPGTSSPTSSPTIDHNARITELAYDKVLEALTDCTPLEVLQDPATVQGQVFLDMVDELVNDVTINGLTDEYEYVFSSLHQQAYMLEKYALRMFYQATTEQRWRLSIYWGSNQDLCDWYGVLCSSLNHQGTCSVYALSLIANKLKGQVPEELCCMPCLRSLTLPSNELYGTLPTCMSNTDWTIDVSDNNLSNINQL